MIRSPAGYGGENRIKRYLDYYQPSYGAMMLAEGLFGFSTPAGVLLGAETSGMAIDFTSAPTSTLVRTANSLSTNYYSGLPFQNEGNGPITFSRASNATVVDSDGKVKWAAHNLLLASEQFDNSNWALANATISANNTTAPNGTTTAEKLVPSAVSGTHRAQQTVSFTEKGTFGFFVKAAGYNYCAVANSPNNFVYFDLTNGAVSSLGTGWGAATCSDAGGGWYYCTATSSAAQTWGNVQIFAVNVWQSNGNTSSLTFTGDGTSGIYLWGAHLYRSDLGGMVANTSAYPMYNPTTPKNLLGYTEAFDVTWSTNLTNNGITANAAIAPNGLNTADLMFAKATNTIHVTQQLVTVVNGTTYTASLYAKAGGYSKIGIRENATTAAYATFDLTNGTVIAQGSGGTGAIVSVGNGWYRISMTSASGSTSFLPTFYIMDNGYTSGSPQAYTYTGDGTSGIYLWGAQLSDSASLDPYTPNHFAAPSAAAYHGPRLDYDPSTLAPKGLLVEEQRTNVLQQSAAFDNAYWTKTASSITTNATTAPDGTNTALKLVENTDTNAHAFGTNTAQAAPYTASIYVKAAERSIVRISSGSSSGVPAGVNVTFNLSTLAVTSSDANNSGQIIAVGNGWYRCTALFAVTSQGRYWFSILDNSGNASYTGDGTSGVFVWGAQLEAGSFATSYIPTTSASVTRSADVAQIGTAAFPYSATEGTWVAGFQTMYSGVAAVAAFALALDNNVSKRIIYIPASADTAATSDGTTIINAAGDVTGAIAKVASSYDGSGRYIASNGGSVSSGTVVAGYSSGNFASIGSVSGLNLLNGHIRQITYIPRRLTNAELQQRTV